MFWKKKKIEEVPVEVHDPVRDEMIRRVKEIVLRDLRVQVFGETVVKDTEDAIEERACGSWLKAKYPNVMTVQGTGPDRYNRYPKFPTITSAMLAKAMLKGDAHATKV